MIALAALAGCGWLPSDAPPPAKPTPPDPDIAEVVHDWKVVGHVLAMKSALSDADAKEAYGRVVSIRASGYTSPWHGHCDESDREKHATDLVEVAADVAVAAAERDVTHRFGLANHLDEYRLSCRVARTPPIVIYVSGTHAMTCFGGVCYLLTR